MARNGYLPRVQDLLRQNGTASVVFDRIRPNPESDRIEEGAEVFRCRGCDFTIGLDALLHAVEAVLSRAAQPLTDLLALDAVVRISRSLPGAVQNGRDIALRCAMSLAAMEAGVCEALTGVISLHAMGLSLGGLAHGAGLALLAPAYFRFLEAGAPGLFERLAEAMSGQAREDDGPSPAFTPRLERLIQESGLGAERLGDHGIGPADVADLVANTFRCAGAHFERTPAPMAAGDVERIFRASLG